jgi:hypothetical protein
MPKTRPRLDTNPKPGNCKNDHDDKPTTPPLPENQFNTIIRAINRNASFDTIKQIEYAVGVQLDRLRVRRRGRMAVAGVPEGSDNVDPQSLYAWAAKVTRADAEAIAQLQVIHATAARRVNG